MARAGGEGAAKEGAGEEGADKYGRVRVPWRRSPGKVSGKGGERIKNKEENGLTKGKGKGKKSWMGLF